MQVQTSLWECRWKTKPLLRSQSRPLGLQDQHTKPTPWKLHLSLRAGAAAQPGLGTDRDGTGSAHQWLLPVPVVAMEITARDRLGFIYQQRIFDLEQKYWSEGGTQPHLKNRLGWLTARDGECGSPSPEELIQPSGADTIVPAVERGSWDKQAESQRKM